MQALRGLGTHGRNNSNIDEKGHDDAQKKASDDSSIKGLEKTKPQPERAREQSASTRFRTAECPNHDRHNTEGHEGERPFRPIPRKRQRRRRNLLPTGAYQKIDAATLQ
jgi:hypothetical protein